jgi:hypothetical protein
MPRFILINETTRCARHVDRDTIVRMIDARFNPGGYTDVAQCLAMIESPERGYMPFPFRDSRGNQYTIHVEGRLDLKGHDLRFRPPDHTCGPMCMIPEEQRRILTKVVPR